MKTAEQIFHCVNDGIKIAEKWYSEEEVKQILNENKIN